MRELESVERIPKVSNRFELLRKLGTGGFGVVYEAFDRERESRVALKSLHRIDGPSLIRFKNEFRTLASLVHPNLVHLQELFCVDETWYFTMELVEGVNFLDYVRPHQDSNSPLSQAFEPETLALIHSAPLDALRLRAALAQVALGVVHLHEAGKIHRDLKPQNLLVGADDRLVILDFGLVADLGETETRAKELVGTPAYMSPEQACAKSAGPASDWYSIGVILYESLTGRLPYDGTALQIISAKRKGKASDPCPQIAEQLQDLGKLSLHLLEADPEKRAGGNHILSALQGDTGSTDLRTSDLFVGRQAHLAILSEALAQAKHKTVTIQVTGSSGMGKTALLRRFAEQVEERGEAIVLSGRCYECETVPYKAIDGLVDALAQHLMRLPQVDVENLAQTDLAAVARLFPVMHCISHLDQLPNPELDTMNPQQLRDTAFSALRRLLGCIAETKTLVVWVDDLQWGDVESTQLFIDFQNSQASSRILLVASYRTEDAKTSDFLRLVLADAPGSSVSSIRKLEVGPLEAQEGEALALAHLLGHDSVLRYAQSIMREAGGSPFFVTELARHVILGGQLGTQSPDSATRRFRLQDALHERIRRLPETAKSVLELVSIAGRGVPIAVVGQAAGLGGEVREALDLLRAERYVRTQGLKSSDLVETYHDRIRETVTAGLSKEQLAITHLQLAQALQSCGSAEPEALAEHFRGAGDSESAFKYTIIAAERAASAVAFSRAAKLYQVALELQPLRDTAAIQIKLAEALANAGHGVLAAQTYLATVPMLNEAHALEIRCKAAEQLLRVGHMDEGMVQVDQLLRAVGMAMPRSLWVAMFLLLVRRAFLFLRGLSFRPCIESDVHALRKLDIGWAAAAGLSNCDTIRGSEIQARTLILALRTGEPLRILRCLTLEVTFVSGGGRSKAKRISALLDATERLAATFGGAHSRSWPAMAKGVSAYFQGYWSKAHQSVVEAEKHFAFCPGTAWERTTASHYQIWSLVYMGKLGEMARLVRQRLREAFERGDLYSATSMRIFTSNLAWLVDDDSVAARRHIQEAMDKWSKKGFHVQHYYALFAECNIDLYEGKTSDAWDRLNKDWFQMEKSFLLRVQVVSMSMHHLRARTALSLATADKSRRDKLLRIARADAILLGRHDAPWAQPTRDLILAGVLMLRGKRDEAIGKLGLSISSFDACGMQLHAAVARRRLGELLDEDQGKKLKEEATDYMKAENLARPDRWTELWAPGFSKPEEQPRS